LDACTSATDATQPESSPQDVPGETLPEPTASSTLTPTDDPTIPIEDATLFVADFESGIPPGIRDWMRQWESRQDADSNTTDCNAPDDDWIRFIFGSEDWSDYAIEIDVQLVSNAPEYGYEIYVRFGDINDGYRASVYNNYANLSFYAPYLDFGGNDVNIAPGEWHTYRVEVVNQTFRYFVDDDLITTVDDDRRASGQAGIRVSTGTEICVDNIRSWAIDENGPIARENVPWASDPNDPLAKYEGDCVFCFVNGNEPDMPIFDSERRGYMPQPDDLREQIVIDETFSVGADEEVVFEDKIVWVRPDQRGDIEVYGTLIVRNTLMLWDQTEHMQTHLRIKKGGTLIIESSYIFWANQYWVYWDYEDGSTILFDNFVGNPVTSISGSVNYTAVNYSTVKLTLIYNTHDSSVKVSDAHHVWFEIFPFAGEYDITFPARHEWVDWEISELWPNTTIEVKNSYLFEPDLGLSEGTHITVRDTPSGFGLGWSIGSGPGTVDCELRDLGDPDQDDGVFYNHMVWDLPCNNSSLAVVNSVLLGAWPVVWGNIHLRIYDSNLVDPRNYGGPTAVMEIYDSTVQNIAAYQGGKIYLENTCLRDDIEVKDANTVIYGYGISPCDAGQEIEIIEVDGGRYIELDIPGPPWD
jgi:hypothetical protein